MNKMTYNELGAVPLTSFKGIGKSRAELFFKQGIVSARDVLDYFPRNYLDERQRTPISEIMVDQDVIIRGRLLGELKNFHKGRMTITNGRIADETGEIPVVWFNQPYLVNNLKAGGLYLFHSEPYKIEDTPAHVLEPEMGKANSHGCVRLRLADAKWMYDTLPLRTKVVIFDE